VTGDFKARLDQLREMTGSREGDMIRARVEVDQVYAHYQHEHLELHHPRGGTAKFLERPLMAHFSDYLARYAREVLNDGGQKAMRQAAEDLSDEVELAAPREWGDLLKSGHPQVHVGDTPVYDRPPKVHRLTKEELRAKSRATLRARLAAGLTVYFMRNGKVMRIPGKNEPHGLRGRL
jgi:hypothetical protein